MKTFFSNQINFSFGIKTFYNLRDTAHKKYLIKQNQ